MHHRWMGSDLPLPLALRGTRRDEGLGEVESCEGRPTFREHDVATKAPRCPAPWAHRASGSYDDGIDCDSFGRRTSLRESRKRDQRFAVVSAGRVVSQKSEASSYAGSGSPMEGALGW